MNNTLSFYSETDLKFRTLEAGDYYKDYFKLLSQLTISPEPEYNLFQRRVTELNERNLEKVFVVEYLPESKIIATITAFIEMKFIHNLGKICHVEDVVVDNEFRKKKLGTKLISLVKEFAEKEGCYKIILDCSDEVLEFCNKMGYCKKSNGMALYFH